ncbi:hypothetical protein JTB14_033761 [Gonioctena quinquepunctata]|nr:hypothetical protein JTB14_033761 [Gonioctena quinquepunctata]
MFKRNTLPQRKPFSFSVAHIIEDVDAICVSEEQQNKLFLCLDEKPPQENKFSQMEEFLKGTNNLESVHETLKALVEEVDNLSSGISKTVNDLKIRAATVKLHQG